MADYDIAGAFERIEDELIASLMRNFSRHRAEETERGIEWSQWQAEQLSALDEYAKHNRRKYGTEFKSLNGKVDDLLRTTYADSGAEQEREIMKAIKSGASVPKSVPKGISAAFFKTNESKLDALVDATTHDLEKAEHAVLRRANDQYRKIIFNAQVAANSGAMTYEQAVDMATKDFLRAGIDSIEYSNGARHTISDYSRMAIRTANKRANLIGEGQKRGEFGVRTVVVNKRHNACPRCAEYVGKVFIDDVYSGGTKADGDYPMLSDAIKSGLFHPNCKDGLSTYYPELTELEEFTDDEIEEMEQREELETKRDACSNEADKLDRMSEYSLDPNNKRKYAARAEKYREREADIKEKLHALDETLTAQKPKAEKPKPEQPKPIATNDSEIPQFKKAKNIKEAESVASEYSENGSVSIDSKMKLEIVNGFNEAADRVYQRYGRKLRIKEITPVKSSDLRYEQGAYNPKSGTVSLANSSIEVYRKKAEKLFTSGWNASKDTYGTFYHEIGHAVWEDLPREAKNQISAIYNREKHKAYLKWMEMGGSSSGVSQAEVFQKSLSRYAHTSTEEFFSEAFSQIMSGRARPVSREVNAILNEKYMLAKSVVFKP